MKNYDICKFTPASFVEPFRVKCFVQETSQEVMKNPYKIACHEMILISNGQGDFKIDDTVIPFVKGDLIFAFKGETVFVENAENVAYMYIQFDGNRADELFRRFNITNATRSFKGFDGLIPMWNESLCRASDYTVDLASESMLLYTFSRLSYNITQWNGLINSVVEIVEKNFDDPDLSINVIASQLSYNAKYISHVFKEKMRISFSEYLRSVRIKFAVSLFNHGIDSVKNVAFLSGFYDPLYFSTVFKKHIGVSPKEYIKNNLKQHSKNRS